MLFKIKSLLFFIVLPVLSIAGEKAVKEADDYFTIQLPDSINSIRILQITDTHFGKDGFWKQDLTTFKRIKRLVEMYDPHLLALTGDILTGGKKDPHILSAFMINFFDSLKRPWLFVFGNHDPEGGFKRDSIAQFIDFSEWGVLGSHKTGVGNEIKYDYVVNLISKGNKPAWQIYAFDSGSEKEFKSIKDDQLDWYRKKSKETETKYAQIVPAISIFHIPLKQYQDLWNDGSIPKSGESREKVCFEQDDGRVYDAFVKVGNIKATFCGHDHYNNYWGTYKGGIILAYGYISGEATNWAWPTGGKLVQLSYKNQNIKIENVVPKFE